VELKSKNGISLNSPPPFKEMPFFYQTSGKWWPISAQTYADDNVFKRSLKFFLSEFSKRPPNAQIRQNR
jgi:hypothetical protein